MDDERIYGSPWVMKLRGLRPGNPAGWVLTCRCRVEIHTYGPYLLADVEVHALLVQEVLEAPWCGHNHVHTLSEELVVLQGVRKV